MPDLPVRPRTLVLCLIDGLGIAPAGDNNAYSKAVMPNFNSLVAQYPVTVLSVPETSEPSERYLAIGQGNFAFKTENDVSQPTLGKILSNANLHQLRLSDNEGFPLLANFFDQSLWPLENVDYKIVEAPTDIDRAFDPVSSSKQISRELLRAIKSEKYDFIAVRFSNVDRAVQGGHVEVAAKALEVFDAILAKISSALLIRGGALALLSAYGRAEYMYNMQSDLPEKGLTLNPVPFLIASDALMGKTIGLEEAPANDLSLLQPVHDLSAVAPTLLHLLGVEKPEEMPGKSWL